MLWVLFVTANLAFASGDIASPTFQEIGIWTGQDGFSSSPTPHCVCDRDINASDCPSVFSSDEVEGSVCYDEFIPAGSGGWVHARVFRRQHWGS